MKIYFPDDPVKQEMLKDLVDIYHESTDRVCNDCLADRRIFDCDCSRSISMLAIEKATGEKIEEVLK